MNKIKIQFKDISKLKEFDRAGYHYTCVKADVENNIYLYKMEHIDEPYSYSQYELVVGVKQKNIDGSVVYTYPQSSLFGSYGWYICGTEEMCQDRINSRISQILERR